MPDQNLSAFAAIRALRDELRARLDQSEDYRAWKALDEVLRQLEPRTMPEAVELALSARGSERGLTAAAAPDRAVNDSTAPKLPTVDDAPLNFRGRA
jgi:hypothetical protein